MTVRCVRGEGPLDGKRGKEGLWVGRFAGCQAGLTHPRFGKPREQLHLLRTGSEAPPLPTTLYRGGQGSHFHSHPQWGQDARLNLTSYSVCWKQPGKSSCPNILFCRRWNWGRKRLRNILKVTQLEWLSWVLCNWLEKVVGRGEERKRRGPRARKKGIDRERFCREGTLGTAQDVCTGKEAQALVQFIPKSGLTWRWMAN